MARARRSNEHWPEDLVKKILLMLPVKSIIRFKCVAKTWNSLFENSNFVSQHLSISKKNNRLLVHHYDNYVDKVVIRLFLDQTLVSYQDLFQQMPQHVNTRYLQFSVHDGLLCLCDTVNSRISLWNPATRKFRLLPECNENIPPKANTFIHTIGFGSNSFLTDYKVIYIRNFVDLETDIPGDRHHAVYRMSTDSWRVLKGEDVDFFEDLYLCNNHNNACVSGVYYWVASKFGQYSKVLEFDLGDEAFQLIEWPPISEPDSIGQLVPLYGDRISLWVSHSDVTSRSNDIWVLNEDRQNWTKLLRIGPLSGIERMYGFWNKNGNKVYVESVSGQLLIYDLDTQDFRDIAIKTGRALYLLEVHIFEESLIATSRDQIK